MNNDVNLIRDVDRDGDVHENEKWRALFTTQSNKPEVSSQLKTFDKERDVNVPSGPGHNLRDYWVHGPGAVKIRWGTEGDFTRCVRNMRKYVKDPEGLCAEYHHQATGMWPGDKRNPGMSEDTVALKDDVLYGSSNGEEDDTVPWHIESRDGKHCVIKDADSSVVKCHDDRADATAHIRALYANEPDMRNVVRSFADDAKKPYGDVRYADPGYQADGQKRYPIDTEEHIRAAWSYISMPKNADKYSPEDLVKVKKRIKSAMSRIGADVANDDDESVTAATATAVVDEPDVVEDDDEIFAVGDTAPWEGVLTVEGIESGDGRMFAANSLTWDTLPFPLMWQKETSHGGQTDKSVRIGSVTDAWREPDPQGRGDVYFIKGRGVIDLGSTDGAEAYRRMKKKFLVGNSVDVDSVKDTNVELVYPENPAVQEGTPVQMGGFFSSPEMTIYHKGRIRATTMVEIPAFTEARLELASPADGAGQTVVASSDVSQTTLAIVESLTAASTINLPDAPPREWFDEPLDVEPLGALTITAEGRIYGYVAPAGVRHRSFADRTVHVPMRNVDYTRFHGGETIVADGSRVVTGPITMNCNHLTPAYRDLTVFDAQEHYENSCSIVASVRVGENEHGVWVAGALLPDVTPAQVTRMMACRLSGDWRPHLDKPGWREFAGALLVPVPGFPMARVAPSVGISDGQLVASAVPVNFQRGNDAPIDHQAVAAFIAKRVGRDPASRVAELRGRVNALRVAALKNRIHGRGE